MRHLRYQLDPKRRTDAGDRSKRMGQLAGIVFLHDKGPVFGDGLVAVQVFGHIEFRQVSYIDFLGHGQAIFQSQKPILEFRELFDCE